MSKESSEHLSSLMDGELSNETGLFLTRRLSSDEGLRDRWERYHLIRDCIRQPGSTQHIDGFCAKLNEALDEEASPSVSPPVSSWGRNRWLKPVSGLAIAASVALMAIVVTAPQTVNMEGQGDTASIPAAQPFVSPNTPELAPVSQAASFASAQQAESNRLNAYLLRHNQMARTAGRQGFVSFVPIVATPVAAAAENSTEEQEPEESKTELESVNNR